MSDRGWLVGMLGDGPDTRKLASRSTLKPWHFPIDTAEIVLDAHSSSLHTLRYSFESGDDIGLRPHVRLELRTMVCGSHGIKVVVTIAVDRKVA